MILCFSCLSNRQVSFPLIVRGEMTSGCEYGGQWGIACTVENRLPERITEMDFILSLFDEDGEPVFATDWMEFHFGFSENPIEQGEERDFFILLDDYLETEPDEPYLVDYFYACRVEYESGRVLEDPFGRYGMN